MLKSQLLKLTAHDVAVLGLILWPFLSAWRLTSICELFSLAHLGCYSVPTYSFRAPSLQPLNLAIVSFYSQFFCLQTIAYVANLL